MATPNFVIQEEASAIVPWYDDAMTHPMVREDGCWQVPQAPGLGVELNEADADKHPFEQEVIPARDAVGAGGTTVDW